MTRSTVTPMEALKRLIAVAKWPDAHWFDSEGDWNTFNAELAVAEMTVRDWVANSKPFAFVIIDERGNPEFVTPDHRSAQEHINDACAQADIEGSGKWKSVAVFEMRPSDDIMWDQTISDRDAYHEWADKLAEAISKHFGAYIGEHSNTNMPWSEALDAIECAAPQPEAAQGDVVLLDFMSENKLHITTCYEEGSTEPVYEICIVHGPLEDDSLQCIGSGKTLREALAMAKEKQ